MQGSNVWFEGQNEVGCKLSVVEASLDDMGEHYVGIIEHMPGMTSVELIEQGNGFVTIRTNEGIMKRTNIKKSIQADKIIVEFDEEYQAGKTTRVRSHMKDVFSSGEGMVIHHTTISGVDAPGITGLLYRKLGKKSIGNALLESYKKYFERTE